MHEFANGPSATSGDVRYCAAIGGQADSVADVPDRRLIAVQQYVYPLLTRSVRGWGAVGSCKKTNAAFK